MLSYRIWYEIIWIDIGNVFHLVLWRDRAEPSTMDTLSMVSTDFSYDVIRISEDRLYTI